MNKCKCNSIFTRKGKTLPEINGFKLIDPWSNEINLLFKPLIPIVRYVIRIMNNNDNLIFNY